MPVFHHQPLEREALYWEHEGNRAMRAGKWKLVAKGPAGKWELYDLNRDRSELNDLADTYPERVNQMAVQWEAWAQRAHVLPWPWKPQYGEQPKEWGSSETVFELKQGESLSRENAPRIQDRPFMVTAGISAMASDGVLIAQGGSAEGFALYLKDSHLLFATRRSGKLTVVRTPEQLPAVVTRVAARMDPDGTVTLFAEGAKLIAQKSPGLLVRMPIDGLQVGRDEKGAVGDYTAPFTFNGKIASASLELF